MGDLPGHEDALGRQDVQDGVDREPRLEGVEAGEDGDGRGEHVTLGDIPADAHRYMLGSRSAIEWLIDRYQVKTDKASGIVNDPNDWGLEHGDPRYIVDLVKRVVRVSVDTMRIVDGLPKLPLGASA